MFNAPAVGPRLLAVAALLSACERQPDPERHAAPEIDAQASSLPTAAVAEPPSGSESVALRPRFRVGDRWLERVEVEYYSARDDEAFGDTPTMLERRREAFDVEGADGGDDGGFVLRVTTEHLEIEPLSGARVESDTLTNVDARHIERFALVGIPLGIRLDADAATVGLVDEDAFREAAEARWLELRAASALGEASAEERARWQAALDGELASTRQWGVRPRLPRDPVMVGDTWSESITTSTLFKAEVQWNLEHRLVAVDPERVTIARSGVAGLHPSATSARYLKGAGGELRSELVLDRRSGALLEATTDLSATLDALPQPEAGFPGGTLKVHTILRRRPVE
ncbi:MAG: hypothetical protein H6710_07905 [Myxococcales bacterium]|nr:hypothetical protein [Myxococcales bacterium]